MKIKRIQSQSFAGLSNLDIKLQPGLNILLGANEAGKSTVVDAIMHGLLTSPHLKSRDREAFAYRFMPRAGGDTVDIKLEFDQGKRSYVLEKYYGSQAAIKLSADGTIYTDEESIQQELQSFLELGAPTLQNIVFARQENFKEMLTRVQEKENIDNIQQFLYQSFMQMDGVSVGKLQDLIEEKISSLQNNWDSENDKPAGNRGIDNPWKRQVGLILKAYYDKESLQQQATEALQLEKQMSKRAQELKGLEKEIEQLKQELEQMAACEDDMMKRQPLEPELQKAEKQVDDLMDLISQWPAYQIEMDHLRTAIQGLQERKQQVEEEKKYSLQQGEKNRLEKLLRLIDEKQKHIKTKGEELKALPAVSAEEMQEVEKLQQEKQDLEIALQATQLNIAIQQYQDIDVWVRCGLEEDRQLQSSAELQASGFFAMEIPDMLRLEVRNAEIDSASIMQQHQVIQEQFDQCLQHMELDTVEQAKNIFTARQKLAGEIQQAKNELQAALHDEKPEHIEKRYRELSRVEVQRSLEEIDRELAELNEQQADLNNKIQEYQARCESWSREYNTVDEAKARLKEAVKKTAILEAEIAQLKPLPEGFADSLAFHEHMKKRRKALAENTEKYEQLREQYRELEQELPEEDCDELEAQAAEAEKRWKHCKQELEILFTVQEAFLESIEEIEQQPFEILQNHLFQAVKILTGQRYEYGRMDPASFAFGLQHAEGYVLPLDLLSAGTYDALALAFRLALLEQCFPQGGGILVLDDCLVDFDEERLQYAVSLLEDFTRRHQVIMMTCHSSIAEAFEQKHLIYMDV